jgi:transcriptional regulator with XRE-family HTH domain
MGVNILSTNLKKLRKIKGLNQDQLADQLGTTRNRIASYESQGVEPKLKLLADMASLFSISVDDLISVSIDESNYKELSQSGVTDDEGVSNMATSGKDQKKHIVVKDKVIDDFIDKYMQVRKMIDGLETYFRLQDNDITLSSEYKQLMFALTHLLEANQSLLSELNKEQIEK